jgi:hypothetical protein
VRGLHTSGILTEALAVRFASDPDLGTAQGIGRYSGKKAGLYNL